MTIYQDRVGLGANAAAVQSRSDSFPSAATGTDHVRAPARPWFASALGALSLALAAGAARAEEETIPWAGAKHALDVTAPAWTLAGQSPARMEAANLNGHAGAEVVARFTPSNSLVVFNDTGMEMRPHRLALSGVTDFALLPSGGIVFATSSGLNLATWNSITNTFTVTSVTGSSAFANATSLSASTGGTLPHVAAIRSDGTSVAWSTLAGSAVSASYTITAPAGMTDARLLRWNAGNPTEVDLAIRTSSTITVRNSTNTVLSNGTFPSFGSQSHFKVERGPSYDRLHVIVPFATSVYWWTLDPVLGGLSPIDTAGIPISALSFGDYDGLGAGDAVATLDDGTGAFILYGNPWNQYVPFFMDPNEPTFAPFTSQEGGPLTALSDFEGDGDTDIITLGGGGALEIPANDRIMEDNFLFDVDMPSTNCSLANHVATFDMASIRMDIPSGVAAGATHVAIEFYVQDSLQDLVSEVPWQTRLVEIPTIVGLDEGGGAPVITLPRQIFTGALGAHPDTSTFHIRLQSVYSPNGTSITTRVAPALTAAFAFDPVVKAQLAAKAALNAWRDRHDVDPVRLGDGNRESSINPFPPRP